MSIDTTKKGSYRTTTDFEKTVFRYLHNLQESGTTNMFGAGEYIQNNYGVEKKEARQILAHWMKNYNKEQNYDMIQTT